MPKKALLKEGRLIKRPAFVAVGILALTSASGGDLRNSAEKPMRVFRIAREESPGVELEIADNMQYVARVDKPPDLGVDIAFEGAGARAYLGRWSSSFKVASLSAPGDFAARDLAPCVCLAKMRLALADN